MKDSTFSYLRNALSSKIVQTQGLLSGKKHGRLRDNLKYIYPSVIKEWKFLAYSIFAMLLISAVTIPMPMVSKFFLDNVLVKKNIHLFIPILLVYGALIVINRAASLFQIYSNTQLVQRCSLDIQSRLLRRLFSLPKFFLDHVSKGYLTSRITADVGAVKWFLSGSVLQIFAQFIKFVAGLYFLFFLSWKISLILLIFLPFPFLSVLFFGKRTHILSYNNRERYAKTYSMIQELVSTISLVKIFSREKKAEDDIIGGIKSNYKADNEQQILGIISGICTEIMPGIAMAFVVIIGAYWVITGVWTLGELWAYRAYLGYVFSPINFMATNINQLQSNRAAMERLAEFFEMSSEDGFENGTSVDNIRGGIKFDNVSFSYDENTRVLKNMNIEVKEGEHLAVVGASGIGKSTFVNIIMCLYRPTEGKLFFGEKDSTIYNVREMRQRIGYVPQKTELLAGTILDNFKFVDEDIKLEEVIEASKIADIHDYISALPSKYETRLDELGNNLSEGQKQRISIARVLIKDPDILIFDEPTASLDNLTEFHIYDKLLDKIKGKTIFTVTHKLSTIEKIGNVIFFIDDSTYISGTHSELMKDERYSSFLFPHC